MISSIPVSSPSCLQEGLERDAQDIGYSIVNFADARVVLNSEFSLNSFLSLQVFMHYPFEREVQPALKKNVFQTRTFGMRLRSASSKDICCTDLIQYTFSMAILHMETCFLLQAAR